MPRSFVHGLTQDIRDVVIHDPREIRHLTRVLRLRNGDQVELVNGQGLIAQGEIVRVSARGVEVRIASVRTVPGHPVRIILACAFPKKTVFEDIIDKCTQLGVDEIVPMVTARTEVLLDRKRAARKEERFEKIALSAVKQCKRLWLPVIHPVTGFEDVVRRFSSPGRAAFIPWLEEKTLSLRDLPDRCRTAESVMFYIGPEGDFTSAEVVFAKEQGVAPLSLGENVLRVDTAAITVIAAAGLIF